MNKQFLKTKKLTPEELTEKSFNIWIPKDLKDRVDNYCKAEDVKIRKFGAEAIESYLKKVERQAKK